MLFHEDADEQVGLLGGLWECRSHKKAFRSIFIFTILLSWCLGKRVESLLRVP